MKVVEKHVSPISRQIHEGVELESSKADIILNSKSEWNHSKIPRIMIEVGEEVESDGMSGMNEGEKLGLQKRKVTTKTAEKRWGDEGDARSTEGKRQRIETEAEKIDSGGKIVSRKDTRNKFKTTGSKKKSESREKDVEGGNRLREWIRVYGIEKETAEKGETWNILKE